LNNTPSDESAEDKESQKPKGQEKDNGRQTKGLHQQDA